MCRVGKLLNAVLAVAYGVWGALILDSNTRFGVVLLGGALCMGATIVFDGLLATVALALGYGLTAALLVMAVMGV